MQKQNRDKNQAGFLLISLVIVLAIILIFLAVEYGKNSKRASIIETGQKAESDLKQSNTIMQQQNMDEQNMLNSDNFSGATGQKAIDQAKGALGK